MDFRTANTITLKPGDKSFPVLFKFPISSGITTNDGTLPFDTVITTANVTGWYNTTPINDLIEGTPQLYSDDSVMVLLSYPTTTMGGITKPITLWLKFILTLDSGTVLEEHFNNIEVS